MEKYTERMILKFSSSNTTPRPIACWFDGKIYRGWEDASKTKWGVKYNRLVRLHMRLKKRGAL